LDKKKILKKMKGIYRKTRSPALFSSVSLTALGVINVDADQGEVIMPESRVLRQGKNFVEGVTVES
jgi:hypothetical protein